MKKHRLLSLVLCLCLLLAGLDQALGLSVSEEEKLGKTVMIRIRQQLRFVDDQVLTSYVENIGRKLAAEYAFMPFKTEFYLVADNQINAFAAPGGTIVVTAGLLEIADSVDELAGVLAHELAHVSRRHLAQQFEQGTKVGIASLIGALAGMLAAAAVGAPQLGQAMMMGSLGAGQAAMLAYSREHEMEADQLGTKVMEKMGYTPRGQLTVLEKIKAAQTLQGVQPPAYLSTHPAANERISFLKTVRGDKPPRPDRPGAADFDWFKARLMASQNQEAWFKDKPPALAEYGLGLVRLNRGQSQEAAADLEKAYRADPDGLGAAVSYAEVLRQSGRPDLAAEVLRGRIRQRPDDRPALLLLGSVLLDLNRPGEAVKTLEELNTIKPGEPQVIQTLGVAYGRLGQLAKAHQFLAWSYTLLGDRIKAMRNFDLALARARDPQEKAKIEAKRKEALEQLGPEPSTY